MKDIGPRLIGLFKTGYCNPQIARLAKKLKQPSTTIHYNIKKLEKEKKIKAYRAVFDYKKLDKGYCVYVMINLPIEDYSDPEKIAKELVRDDNIESVDICTWDFELVIKLRTKDVDEYYDWVKRNSKRFNFKKILSITSLKQLKTEFIELEWK